MILDLSGIEPALAATIEREWPIVLDRLRMGYLQYGGNTSVKPPTAIVAELPPEIHDVISYATMLLGSVRSLQARIAVLAGEDAL